MKKIILALLILAGAASVQAQQDTTMKKKMHHDKMKMDSSGHKMKKEMNKSDSMHTKPMYKKKKDSTAAKQ